MMHVVIIINAFAYELPQNVVCAVGFSIIRLTDISSFIKKKREENSPLIMLPARENCDK